MINDIYVLRFLIIHNQHQKDKYCTLIYMCVKVLSFIHLFSEDKNIISYNHKMNK